MKRTLTDLGFRILSVVGSAMVLQFFSEYYFLNEGPARALVAGWTALPDLLIGIYVYGIFAYLFHIVIDRFQVGQLAGLVLAGAVFGWATEALVVPVAHEAPPISWAWPSLGWHAVVDVLAGWYLLRLAMRRLLWPWLILLYTGLGIVWAFWAGWTWSMDGDAALVFSKSDFRNIALIAGTTWMLGTVLVDIGARHRFRASLAEILLITLFCGWMFLETTLAYLPFSLGLVAVIGLTFWALWSNRATSGDLLTRLTIPPPLPAYLAMPALPVAAGLTYPLVLDRGLQVPSQDIVLLLLVAGVGFFTWALWRAFRPAQRSAR